MSESSERTLGPFVVGIDSVSPESALPEGALADAVNVDLDMTGAALRRAGRTRGLAQAGMDSAWTSRLGRSYCAVNKTLVRLSCNGTTVTATHLADLLVDEPLSFDDLNGEVVFSNSGQIGVIDPNDVVRPLGLEVPLIPSVSNSVGALGAGRRACAIAYVSAKGEEGGLSPIIVVNLSDSDGGVRFDVIPQPSESIATGINLYCSEAGAKVLRLAARVPVGTTSYSITGGLGRPASNRNQVRMPPGRIVRQWNGFLVVAAGPVIYFSPSLAYGRCDPRKDLIPFPHDVVLMEPVVGGIFAGTQDGVFFLGGTKPQELTFRRTGAKPPNPFSGIRAQQSELAGDGGSEVCAMWVARNGFVIGNPDGSIREPQAKHIRIPRAQWSVPASLLLHERRVTAVLN